jgi:hypothetical protein
MLPQTLFPERRSAARLLAATAAIATVLLAGAPTPAGAAIHRPYRAPAAVSSASVACSVAARQRVYATMIRACTVAADVSARRAAAANMKRDQTRYDRALGAVVIESWNAADGLIRAAVEARLPAPAFARQRRRAIVLLARARWAAVARARMPARYAARHRAERAEAIAWLRRITIRLDALERLGTRS